MPSSNIMFDSLSERSKERRKTGKDRTTTSLPAARPSARSSARPSGCFAGWLSFARQPPPTHPRGKKPILVKLSSEIPAKFTLEFVPALSSAEFPHRANCLTSKPSRE